MIRKSDVVWSPKAIDYSFGVDIFDNLTKTFYSEEEARKLPREVRSRLTMKPRKIGAFVKTIEGLRK